MALADRRLALIEVFDRDGRLLRLHEVHEWPVSVGRDLGCELVLDDPHVAARHAVIDADAEGRPRLQVGRTVNGVWVGRRRLAEGESVAIEQLPAGFQVGLSRLRVRLPGEALAPEQPLAIGRHHALAPLGYALGLWALLIGEHWIGLDPGSRPSDWIAVVFGAPLALVLWSALWALASKLFRHRFDFESHFLVAARWGFWLGLADIALPWLAAAVGSPGLFRWVEPLVAVGGAAWLVRHASLVLPQRRRTLAAMAVGALAAAGAVGMTLRHQNEAPLVGPLYMSQLPQPGLRLARPQPPASFVEQLQALHPTLDARARDNAADAPDPAEDGEE